MYKRFFSEKGITKVQAAIIAITLVVAAVAGVAYYLSLPPPTPAEPLRIGVLVPMTGGSSYNAPEMMHGALSAIEKINEAGGVLGHLVEVYIEDDQSLADQALLASRKLIEINRVKGVVGPLMSSQACAIAPIFIENNVLLFTAAGADDISYLKDNGFVYRVSYFASEYAASQVKVALEIAKGKRVSLMTENQPWGLSVAKYIKKLLTKAGVDWKEIVYDMGKASYRSEIEIMMAFNPDVMMLTGWEPDVMAQMKSAYELGYRGAYALSGYSISEDFPKKMGEIAEGMLVAFEVPFESPHFKEVKQTLEARWKHKFIYTWGFGLYDAVTIICLAAVKAGTTTDAVAIKNQVLFVSSPPGKVVETFKEGKDLLTKGEDIDFNGVFVRDYNEYGDIPKGYFDVYRVEKGKLVKIGAVEAEATYIG